MTTTATTTTRMTLALSIVLLHAWSAVLMAQPVDRDVLDRVEIARGERAVTLYIYFRFPVHYVRHFPYESGDTLLIHVTPTNFEKPDPDAPRREALRAPDDPDVPITDIIYDERTLWSPYLMLHFSRPVGFRVNPGADARSIVVEFPLTQTPVPASSPSPPALGEDGTP